nr:hypothetical protein [Tanacetum cinerariifolium]
YYHANLIEEIMMNGCCPCLVMEMRRFVFLRKVENEARILSRLNLKMPSAVRGVMKTDMVLAGVESKFEIFLQEDMDSDSTYMMAESKVPMLKPENGRSLLKTQVVEGVTTLMPISFVEDKAKKMLEVKARSTLMMGIPNERQLKFNSIKDAKQLMEAIEKRFGGNTATNKTQSNLLKQQYENFTGSNSEMLDQTFDRLQKLIYPDDLEEMDLKWQMAMLTMRDKRFLKKIGRKLTIDGNDTIGFDKSNVECYNFHKKGHFAREFRAPKSQDTKHKESTRRTEPVETPASMTLVSCDGLGGYDWNEFTNKHVVENCDAKTSETKPKDVRKNNDAPIIEGCVLDEEEEVTQPNIEHKTVKQSILKIEFIKPKQPEKKARKTVKQVEKPRHNTHRPRGNQKLE